MSFDLGNIIDTVRQTASRLMDAFTPPPPPPQTAEQIDQRIEQAIGNDQRWPPEGQRTSEQQQARDQWYGQYQLLQSAYTQAVETGDGALWQQTEALATAYHDREILALSRSIGETDAVPDGWSRATDEQLADYGLSPEDMRPDDSGFNAELFIPDPAVYGPDAAPVLQFEGTDFADLSDVNADVAQAMGNDEEYYNRAIDIATQASSHSGGNIVFSGHSLGGGLATAASLATGAPAIVSNPAGVHPETVSDALAERGLTFEQADANVTTYVVDGDVLTELQDATAGLSDQNADIYAAILNGVGQGINLYQDEAVFPTDVTGDQVLSLPDAVGSVTTLEAVNADGSARPDVIELDDIIDDINDRVEAMPLSDLGDFVEGSSNVVSSAINWLTGGQLEDTWVDWIEQGGNITEDMLDGIETVASTAVSGLDGDVRDSVLEMVDRHSFGVFDGALENAINEQEAAVQAQLG